MTAKLLTIYTNEDERERPDRAALDDGPAAHQPGPGADREMAGGRAGADLQR